MVTSQLKHFSLQKGTLPFTWLLMLCEELDLRPRRARPYKHRDKRPKQHRTQPAPLDKPRDNHPGVLYARSNDLTIRCRRLRIRKIAVHSRPPWRFSGYVGNNGHDPVVEQRVAHDPNEADTRDAFKPCADIEPPQSTGAGESEGAGEQLLAQCVEGGRIRVLSDVLRSEVDDRFRHDVVRNNVHGIQMGAGGHFEARTTSGTNCRPATF
jgi:hypothetical protein